MLYTSTRGEDTAITAGQAIVKGIADDGGLYVPERIPVVTLDMAVPCSYQDMAMAVLRPYLTDYSEEEIRNCVERAYGDTFDTTLIAPLVTKGGSYFLELFHGPTLAFKDMALSILPHLLTTAAEKQGEQKKIIILTATSGDTGKAAMEGFADVEGVSVLVFYPENGVSEVQKLQMLTARGRNTFAIGVHGNFDDAQRGVKALFTDKAFNQKLQQQGYVFSSANSINIGRLLPQIVYYFYAYAQMVQTQVVHQGEKINFTVPTGNFGNILAGYYARAMGLPVHKLICASNDNKVLHDFFRTGRYDANRELITTASPSMDILVSSNLERLLYHNSGSTARTNTLMEKLSREGAYSYTLADDVITGEYATEQEAFQAIKEMYERQYVIDPHTAVAYAAARKYEAASGDSHKNVIVATASPYKFSESVCHAIDSDTEIDALAAIDKLSRLSHTPVPAAIQGLDKKEKRGTSCKKDEMQMMVESFMDNLHGHTSICI